MTKTTRTAIAVTCLPINAACIGVLVWCSAPPLSYVPAVASVIFCLVALVIE